MGLNDFYEDAERPRGGKWVKLKKAGDKVVGDLISIDIRDRTDLQGNILVAKSGKVRKSYVVTIQTDEQENADDDGIRKFDGNESAQTAIIDAYKKVGGGDIAGARIAIQLTKEAPDTFSQASYACVIKKTDRPVTVPVDDLI